MTPRPPANAPLSFSDLQRATGRGVRVLVVDSGVEVGHPALSERDVACWRVTVGPEGKPAVARDSGGDVFGHGTAVAAIVRAHAPDAVIDSIQVLGGDLRASSPSVLFGLHWGIEQGYDVINCSFGSTNPAYLPEYKRIVDRAFCSNAILVSACNNSDFRKAFYPACFPSVLATDFGPVEGLALRRRRGQLVEFVARGEGVRVAWKGGTWRTSTGSSFAAPHLTALVARARQLRPGWNACQLKSFLYDWAANEDPAADAAPRTESASRAY